MHFILVTYLFIITITCFVTYVAAGVSRTRSDDIIVGGINGPVNFSRPEGERLFYYYVPSSYTPSKPLPFVIYFHGYGGNWSQGVEFNQTIDAEANNYILGLGQGTPSAEGNHVNGWNGGTCCLFNTTIIVDDVTYAKQVVRLASEQVAIAQDRVYAMGWSNGGYMTERIGCEAADVFTGVAPDASSIVIGTGYEDGLSKCDAAFQGKHIDYIHFHGLMDKTVPWVGGHDDRERLPSTLENISRWVTRNGCDNINMQTYNNGDFSNIRWPNCRGNTSMELMTVWYAQHIWWTMDNGNFSTADYIMKSFTQSYMERQKAKLSSSS